MVEENSTQLLQPFKIFLELYANHANENQRLWAIIVPSDDNN